MTSENLHKLEEMLVFMGSPYSEWCEAWLFPDDEQVQYWLIQAGNPMLYREYTHETAPVIRFDKTLRYYLRFFWRDP